MMMMVVVTSAGSTA